MINRTEKYEKFVISQVYKVIAKSNGCTKKDAWTLFVNALAYNTVVEEILDKTKMLAADLVQGDSPAMAVKDVAAGVKL